MVSHTLGHWKSGIVFTSDFTTCTFKLFNGNFGKPALSEPTGLLSITSHQKMCKD